MTLFRMVCNDGYFQLYCSLGMWHVFTFYRYVYSHLSFTYYGVSVLCYMVGMIGRYASIFLKASANKETLLGKHWCEKDDKGIHLLCFKSEQTKKHFTPESKLSMRKHFLNSQHGCKAKQTRKQLLQQQICIQEAKYIFEKNQTYFFVLDPKFCVFLVQLCKQGNFIEALEIK